MILVVRSSTLQQIKVADFIIHNEDWSMPKAASRDACLTGHGNFTCKSVWNALRTQHPTVHWAHMLWHKDHIPKCNVIYWLAYKDRWKN